MAKSRLELHEILCELLGSRNVYFQPPENFKINYPCIVYHMSQIASKKADDKVYTYDKRYEMTYISDDPDSEFPEKMLTALMYCTHDSHYTSDGLHHDKFVVYY